MTAGLNSRFNIWRMSEEDDDYSGGASITGTVVYYNVRGNLQGVPQEQVYLQQGLEVYRTFKAIVVPATLDIRERDELQVTRPRDHMYYGSRFRIIGVTYSSLTPRQHNATILLDLSRSVRAHNQQ